MSPPTEGYVSNDSQLNPFKHSLGDLLRAQQAVASHNCPNPDDNASMSMYRFRETLRQPSYDLTPAREYTRRSQIVSAVHGNDSQDMAGPVTPTSRFTLAGDLSGGRHDIYDPPAANCVLSTNVPIPLQDQDTLSNLWTHSFDQDQNYPDAIVPRIPSAAPDKTTLPQCGDIRVSTHQASALGTEGVPGRPRNAPRIPSPLSSFPQRHESSPSSMSLGSGFQISSGYTSLQPPEVVHEGGPMQSLGSPKVGLNPRSFDAYHEFTPPGPVVHVNVDSQTTRVASVRKKRERRLTDDGKAHARDVRRLGACSSCRKKKRRVCTL